MEIANGLEQFAAPPGGVVLTIGNFDGVHRGHARLIARAQAVADRRGAPVTVLTLEPHPLAILAPERAPAQLTTLREKLALLERLGVGRAIVLRSEPALLAQQAVDFLAALVAHCRPRALVEGPDFNFGRGRSGSVATLQEHAARWEYELHVVPAVHCQELPTHPVISSTSIRQALTDGRIADANIMLGRPYRIVGTTGHGEGRGATLGFPTANLEEIPHLLPQQAIYAAAAQFESGELHLAAVNIGPQPTFGQEAARVEAHVLDFTGMLRGRRLGLYFLTRLREQQRFETPAALSAQIGRDVAATRGFAAQLETIRRAGLLPLE
ncbi:MAG: riboflavin biosynthesis protein RibF [Planctomycetota bacterium]